jgi:hypothetical protein
VIRIKYSDADAPRRSAEIRFVSELTVVLASRIIGRNFGKLTRRQSYFTGSCNADPDSVRLLAQVDSGRFHGRSWHPLRRGKYCPRGTMRSKFEHDRAD